jgi:hypothetical protein
MVRIALAAVIVVCAGCMPDRIVALPQDAPHDPQLTISDVRRSFGGVEVGTSATATIRVSNTGSGASKPLVLVLTGDDRSFVSDGACAGKPVAAGASCDLRVTFTPQAFGRTAATLAIADSLSVALDGYGRGTVKLSIRSTGGGHVDLCFAGPCTIPFEVGETVPSANVEATADAGWTIAGWSGDCAGTSPHCDLRMDRDRAVAVSFAKLATVSVEATVVGGGGGDIRIDPSASCHAPCRLTTTVVLGTAVTLSAAPDANSQFRWTQDCPGTDATCAFAVDSDAVAKVVFNGANYVFVTSTKYSSNAGVAAYDAACSESARAGGLPGPFLAWVTTSSMPAERRIGAARGFIRLDGRRFMDVLDPAAPVGYPVVFDEHEQPVGPDLLDREYLSGRTIYGQTLLGTCEDWTTNDPSFSHLVITGDPLGGAIFWDGWSSTFGGCALRWRLLCVGTALTRPLEQKLEQGRIAFASDRNAFLSPDRGIQGFDDDCAAQASAAKLPGTYKSLVASDGASAVSRFDLTGPAWVRPDGVALLARASDLADGKLIAPIDVLADSTPDGDVNAFFTGAPSPGVPGTRDTTCNGWTSAFPDVRAIVGRNSNIEPRSWFDLVAIGCDFPGRVYCFQQ